MQKSVTDTERELRKRAKMTEKIEFVREIHSL